MWITRGSYRLRAAEHQRPCRRQCCPNLRQVFRHIELLMCSPQFVSQPLPAAESATKLPPAVMPMMPVMPVVVVVFDLHDVAGHEPRGRRRYRSCLRNARSRSEQSDHGSRNYHFKHSVLVDA
jgi:hypothetical protein